MNENNPKPAPMFPPPLKGRTFSERQKRQIKTWLLEEIGCGVTQAAALRKYPGLPSYRTIDRWKEEDAQFASDFARARESGFDAIADESLRIADDSRDDYYTDEATGELTLNRDNIARARLRCEHRLKLLSKWSKRYSDRSHVELETGPSLAEALKAARIRANTEPK